MGGTPKPLACVLSWHNVFVAIASLNFLLH
jgi:hypothetical protein